MQCLPAENATGLTKCLKMLLNLDILEWEVLITEENPERSKKGLYKIKDNYLRFWFAFVYPNMSFIESGHSGRFGMSYMERIYKK